MDERNEEGLSISEFFKMVWSQKILALIVLVAITLVGTLGIYFGYNAMSAKYTVTYRMSFPDTENFLNDYTYPDGNVFYYTSLVSENTLNAVKESDARFANVKNRDISIVYNYTTTTSSTTQPTEATFTLSASKGSFDDILVARDFLVELARYPVQHFAEIEYDYSAGLNTYNISKTDAVTNYDGLLDILDAQLTSIQDIYTSYEETYGGSFTLLNTTNQVTSLAAYKSQVDAYAQTSIIDILKLEVSQQGIIKSEALKSSLQLRLNAVTAQLNDAKTTLSIMIGNPSTVDAGSAAELRAQQNLVNSLTGQQAVLTNYIESEVNEDYMTKLDEIYTVLEGYTNDLEMITKQINVKVASVTFMSNQIIEVEEVSALISVVISLLVGLIVAIIVGYCVASSKLKKAIKAANATNTTVEEQTKE